MIKCGYWKYCVLTSMVLFCFDKAVAQQSQVASEDSSVIERGIAAAQDGNWSLAYSAFVSSQNSNSSYPIYYFIAVSAARQEDAETAFRYSRSSNDKLEVLPKEHSDQRDSITYWSRPSVIGTSADCSLAGLSGQASYCEIDQPGALEQLVEEYFEVRLLDLMNSAEWFDAKAARSCEYAGVDFGDPAVPPDSKVRCEARRAFSLYDYGEHPPDEWHLNGFGQDSEQ